MGKAKEVDSEGEKLMYVGRKIISGAWSVTKELLCLCGNGWILWAVRENLGCSGSKTERPVVVKYEDREE